MRFCTHQAVLQSPTRTQNDTRQRRHFIKHKQHLRIRSHRVRQDCMETVQLPQPTHRNDSAPRHSTGTVQYNYTNVHTSFTFWQWLKWPGQAVCGSGDEASTRWFTPSQPTRSGERREIPQRGLGRICHFFCITEHFLTWTIPYFHEQNYWDGRQQLMPNMWQDRVRFR